MKRIVVAPGEYSYPITTVSGLFGEPVSSLPLEPDEQIILVTNGTLTPLHLDKVHDVLEQASVSVDSVILLSDEQYRSPAILDTVFTVLLQKPHGRGTMPVALDDDVVGDLAGFVATGYRYGARFVQAPTALLSQVDSSVGSKAVISRPLGRNMISAFCQPTSVMVNPGCLKTLPPRELASGLARVIKYDIILNDMFFSRLGENLDALLRPNDPVMACYIRHCCELETEAVAADKHGTRLCALLNLGHTFGHTIGAKMGYGNWLYGEVVTAGMVIVARTSERLGQFSSAETQHIITPLKRTRLPVNGPRETSAQTYLLHMLRDKKVLTGGIRLILPLTIGKSRIRNNVSHELILNAIANCQPA